MKPLHQLNDTADHLREFVHAAKRRLSKIRSSVLKPAERKPSTASRLKIEIVRDVCEQPAVIPDHMKQQRFAQFTQLPTEIRLLIWYFASSVGRVVELQLSMRTIGFRNCAAPRPPAVLHACHESRTEALKILRPFFGREGRRKPIYIHPANDTLFFRLPIGGYTWQARREWTYTLNGLCQKELFREELKDVRRVAFMWRDIGFADSLFTIQPVSLLPTLEEFVIVWSDWSLRSFEGRGVNFIEGIAPCVHDVHTRTVEISEILKRWEARLRWERLRSKGTVLTLRHWCLRDEED